MILIFEYLSGCIRYPFPSSLAFKGVSSCCSYFRGQSFQTITAVYLQFVQSEHLNAVTLRRFSAMSVASFWIGTEREKER